MDYQKELASFKRRNNVAKLKKAQKEGFQTIEEYKTFLEDKIANQSFTEPATKPAKTTTKKSKTEKPIIYVVDILDISGSMSGIKFLNALKGINSSLKELKEENNIKYFHLFTTFNHIVSVGQVVEVSKAIIRNIACSGTTALFDGIGKTLDSLKTVVKDGEKVLVNIYTDGGENSSLSYKSKDISSMIEELQSKGYTITFVGTNYDVEEVQRVLKIKKGNTLSYDGSAKGLEKAMGMTNIARTTYSKAVLDGEDVSDNFYHKVMN